MWFDENIRILVIHDKSLKWVQNFRNNIIIENISNLVVSYKRVGHLSKPNKLIMLYA